MNIFFQVRGPSKDTIAEFLISWELRFSMGHSRSIYQSRSLVGMARQMKQIEKNRSHSRNQTRDLLPRHYKAGLYKCGSTTCIHIFSPL